MGIWRQAWASDKGNIAPSTIQNWHYTATQVMQWSAHKENDDSSLEGCLEFFCFTIHLSSWAKTITYSGNHFVACSSHCIQLKLFWITVPPIKNIAVLMPRVHAAVSNFLCQFYAKKVLALSHTWAGRPERAARQ